MARGQYLALSKAWQSCSSMHLWLLFVNALISKAVFSIWRVIVWVNAFIHFVPIIWVIKRPLMDYVGLVVGAVYRGSCCMLHGQTADVCDWVRRRLTILFWATSLWPLRLWLSMDAAAACIRRYTTHTVRQRRNQTGVHTQTNLTPPLIHNSVNTATDFSTSGLHITFFYCRKRPTLYCSYLRQILTDFQNSFTGTLWGQFATKWLLNIPPHLNSIATIFVKYKCKK